VASAKYPRTPHLPWSPGASGTDKRLVDVAHLLDRDLVLTEKLDGSNLTMTREAVFARSHEGAPRHESFNHAKALHARLRHRIAAGWSVFGEYVFAVHSIRYTKRMPSCFFVFGVRDDRSDRWFAWDEVKLVAEDFDLPHVTELMVAEFGDEQTLAATTSALGREPSAYGPTREGVVARIAEDFAGSDFHLSLAKWVRAGHVQTTEHWTRGPVVRNPCET